MTGGPLMTGGVNSLAGSPFGPVEARTGTSTPMAKATKARSLRTREADDTAVRFGSLEGLPPHGAKRMSAWAVLVFFARPG
jgi:hypothetical protein